MDTTMGASASAEGVNTGNKPGGEERQIAVRLTTQDSAYSIPSTKFLVPASWRRFHLSELINKVLENEPPIPFDFLINSSLLRSSLGAYCAQTGTSEEVTLEIEYLPSTLPPQLQSQVPSDDLVSDVSLGLKGTILTASYAGTVSLSSPNFPAPATLTFVGHDRTTPAGHDRSVLSACHVAHPGGSSSGKHWVASGGMDRVGRVWEYQMPQESLTNPGAATLPVPRIVYALHLHSAPIASVCSRPLPSSSDLANVQSPPHLLTAGWDGVVGVWDLSPGVKETPDSFWDDPAGGRKLKRRKQETDGIYKTPVGVLRGHTGTVSRVLFDRVDSMRAYTAGCDHTVRSWDLETGSESESKTSDKVLLSLTQLASRNLLCTGSMDRQVSLWDLGASESNIALTLSGHQGPVKSVCAHPTNPTMLASGSYDGTVRVWDVRCEKQALFVLPMPPREDDKQGQSSSAAGSGAQGEKVMAVDWDGERLAAGGEGKRVVVWNVSADGQQPKQI